MSEKIRQKPLKIVKNNLFMMGRMWKYAREYFILNIIFQIIWGIIHSVNAVYTYSLLNIVSENGDFASAARLIVHIALFFTFAYAFDKTFWYIRRPLVLHKLTLGMHGELFEKARSLDLACFDDPRFYDDFVWAMNNCDSKAVEVFDTACKMINRIISSATMIGLLFVIDPVIAALLITSSLITTVCGVFNNKMWYLCEKKVAPLYRKKNYINRVYRLADHSKEIRISRANELLFKEYDLNSEKIIKNEKYYRKRCMFLGGIAWDTLGTLTFYAVLIYMIGLLKTGSLEIGAFAASATLVWNLRWAMTDLVSKATEFPKYSLYVEKYLEFLRSEPEVTGKIKDIPDFESLELRNVSFSYDFSNHKKYEYHDKDYTPPAGEGSEKEALKDVSMTINKGEKVAIVGYNGAGKTTLIKLIMRFYDPTEGEILYNGVNIKNFDPPSYREKIGAVFQDFKLFAATLADNVVFGKYEPQMEEKVLNALECVDFSDKLASLENGILTPLTKEFDNSGTVLSGGEAQKVAISRVFAADRQIVIMDEPSSALDPNAEYELNKSILNNTRNKTVIFISHRLSTTRIADRIYMFDSGRLTECGGHAELMARKGKYCEMFELQADKYRRGEEYEAV